KENAEMVLPLFPIHDIFQSGRNIIIELVKTICRVKKYAGRKSIPAVRLEAEFDPRITAERLSPGSPFSPGGAHVAIDGRVEFVEVELEKPQVYVLEDRKAVERRHHIVFVPSEGIERISLHADQTADVKIEEIVLRRAEDRPGAKLDAERVPPQREPDRFAPARFEPVKSRAVVLRDEEPVGHLILAVRIEFAELIIVSH